jgi:N-acetylmuramoyl-L-alanine amidase
VIDPGHQLGNSRFPRQTSQQVPAGGFTKPCNTSGTSTNAGFPESTFNFRVAQRLLRQLEWRGARVVMTRTRNSVRLWGPCVDERGRRGNRVDADVKVSIHGDGSYADGRGFHLIAPTDRAPWTHDIHRSSRRLAAALRRGLVRSGFVPADYVAGGDGLDVRADLATLNLSDIPTVVVEAGNMRNRADARVMSSRAGQYRYARALRRGIRGFLAG